LTSQAFITPHDRLYPFEWVLIAFFSASLIALSLYTSAQAEAPLDALEGEMVTPYQIIVTISGAVKNEGEFLVPYGTTLREALRLAEPLADADLSKIKGDKPLLRKQKIKLPFKKVKKLKN
jgi:hypothetical protein